LAAEAQQLVRAWTAIEQLPALLVPSEHWVAPTPLCLIHRAQDESHEPISGLSFDEAVVLGTGNLGNQVWNYGARALLSATVAQASEAAAGAHLNATALLLPFANSLRTLENTNQDVLNRSAAEVAAAADMVVRRNLPTLIVGIGSQSLRGTDPRRLRLGPQHLRLLKEVSRRGAISVRGQFTADLIRHNGGPPTMVAGCPSLFLNTDFHLGRRLQDAYRALPALASARPLRFAIGLPSDCHRSEQLAITLLRLVAEHPGSFVVVQDANDFKCIDTHGPRVKLSFRNVRYFYSVRAWARALGQVDALVSARIHGSMMGLAAVRPMVVITTDMRIWELADVMRLPYVWQDAPKVRAARMNATSILTTLASTYDGAAFDANRYRIAAMYRDMFARITMPLHPAVLEMAAAHKQHHAAVAPAGAHEGDMRRGQNSTRVESFPITHAQSPHHSHTNKHTEHAKPAS